MTDRSVKSSSDAVWTCWRSWRTPWWGRAHACEFWAREREQVVPRTDELCVQERSCTSLSWWTQPPARPTKLPGWARGRSSLSRPAEKRLFSDKLGRAWLWCWLGRTKGEKALFYSFNTVPSRKIRIGGSRLLQIKGTRSFQVKKGGSLSSIRRVGSLKSSKLSRQDSESEAEELQLSQSRDTVTDLGNIEEWVCAGTWGVGRQSPNSHTAQVHFRP